MPVVDDWWARAECRDADPSLFEAPHGGSSLSWTLRPAAICGRCQVRAQCLEDYLEHATTNPRHEASMFVAGFSPAQLSHLLQRRSA